jgi:hypothetical protein
VDLRLEELGAGGHGHHLHGAAVLLASTAAALAAATGLPVPDRGPGLYLGAFWGEQPSGGYALRFLAATADDGQLALRLTLHRPGPDAMVTQALTSPYALALLPAPPPVARGVRVEDRHGAALAWPVRRVGE